MSGDGERVLRQTFLLFRGRADTHTVCLENKFLNGAIGFLAVLAYVCLFGL